VRKYVKKIINKTVPGIKSEIERLHSIDEKLSYIKQEITKAKTDFKLYRLKELLAQVEHYQPVYHISGVVDSPKRHSHDRCLAIENKIGPIAGKRVLDIGSSLGYFSFFMADRGAVVEGWEENVRNAEAARLIGELNGIGVDFKTKEFNVDTVKTIRSNEFDVALLLSVVHHIIRFNGIEPTKKLIKDLMDRVPVLVVELAKKGENPSLVWDSAQPKDELEIFELVKDDIEIEKIGDFKNHLSNKTRPLYLISKKKVLRVNSKNYEYELLQNIAYKGSPVAYRDIKRRYYFGKDFIAKEYVFDNGLPKDTYIQIFNEINVLTKLSDKGIYHLPRLIDFELQSNRAVIIFERIEGELLSSGKLKHPQMKKVIQDVFRTLDGLHEAGYYHNDIRAWNVIISPDKKQAFLIDFGLADPIAQEDDIASAIQLIVENDEGASPYSSRLSRTELGKKLSDEWATIGQITGKQTLNSKDVLAALKEK
jgi:O-antigen chain-terminating methyltransferase